MKRSPWGKITKRGSRWRAFPPTTTPFASQSFATRQAASDYLADLRRGLVEPKSDPVPTLSRFWAQEVAALIAADRNPATIRWYLYIGAEYVEKPLGTLPPLGTKPLDKITPRDIEDRMTAIIIGLKLSPSTANGFYRAVRRMFGAAYRCRVLKRIHPDPCAEVKPIYRPKQKRPVYTWSQVDQILDAAHHATARAAILIAVETGMRESEVAAITWDDVEAKRLVINKKISWRPKEAGTLNAPFTVDQPKAHSARTFPLVGHSGDRIRAALAQIPRTGPFIFAQSNRKEHRPVYNTTLYKWLQIAIAAANARESGLAIAEAREPALIPRISFHRLRSTLVSRYLAEGVSLTLVSGLVGHRSTRTTQDHYEESLESDMAEAIEKASNRRRTV